MLDTVVPAQTLLLADRAGACPRAGAARPGGSDALRQRLAERGASGNVEPLSNRKRRQMFCAFPYKEPSPADRFSNRIKHF